MENCMIPVPTRESIAWALADLLGDAFQVEEPEVFWYTYLTEHPDKVQDILSSYRRKHPGEETLVDTLKDALRKVTEDEQGAFEQAALTLG